MTTVSDSCVALFDACVLAPMPVCDTVLRLAEADFFVPKWSRKILDEVESTLIQKLKYSGEQAKRRTAAMENAFEDACVDGYEELLPQMRNHAKDRHVLAAAVVGAVHVIVTDNLKDFPLSALSPYGLIAQTSDDFLIDQYQLDPDLFLNILNEQAGDRRCQLSDLIRKLSLRTPKLAKLIGGNA